MIGDERKMRAALVEELRADGYTTSVEWYADHGRVDLVARRGKHVRIIEIKTFAAGLLKAFGQLHLYALSFPPDEWPGYTVDLELVAPEELLTPAVRAACRNAGIRPWVRPFPSRTVAEAIA